MQTVAHIGSYCIFPRQAYSAATLPAEYHPAVMARLTRAAYRDLLAEAYAPDPGRERIRTAAQRAGILERAEDAAAAAYLKWLAMRGIEGIAAGDHDRAANATIRYMRRSGWRGFTGQRRAKNRQATAERLAFNERRREALQDRPDAVAMAKERIGNSPHLARKAYRLAQRAGIPGGVPELLTLATLAESSGRGAFMPAPSPREGLPATAGDGTEFRAADCGWQAIEPGHYVRLN